MKSNSRKITVSALKCPHCLEVVWSRHVHDFRYCFCTYCFIDGGRDYTRIGYGWENMKPEDAQVPESLRIRVDNPRSTHNDKFPH